MFLLIWLGFCVWVGFAANNKGRSGVGWAVLAFLFSPLLMGIALALVKDLKVDEEVSRVKAEQQQLKDRVVSNEKLTEHRLGRVENDVSRLGHATPGSIPNAGPALIGEGTRFCPACAEVIRSAAIKCKHCGVMVDSIRMKNCKFCDEGIPELAKVCSHCNSTVN